MTTVWYWYFLKFLRLGPCKRFPQSSQTDRKPQTGVKCKHNTPYQTWGPFSTQQDNSYRRSWEVICFKSVHFSLFWWYGKLWRKGNEDSKENNFYTCISQYKNTDLQVGSSVFRSFQIIDPQWWNPRTHMQSPYHFSTLGYRMRLFFFPPKKKWFVGVD